MNIINMRDNWIQSINSIDTFNDDNGNIAYKYDNIESQEIFDLLLKANNLSFGLREARAGDNQALQRFKLSFGLHY